MGILNSMSGAVKLSTTTPKKDESGTMEGRVANILNGNSLLMNSAAAKGERVAAQRGLQNSTIGVEAAQRAMLDAAAPIAAQDSQNEQQTKMANLQADLSLRNQNEQNKFAAGQADLDRGHQKSMAQLQGDINFNNQSRLNKMQNEFAASQSALDRSHQASMQQNSLAAQHRNQMALLEKQVAANTIGKSIEFAQNIASGFDAQIASVLNNGNMTAQDKASAIGILKKNRDSELSFMSEFMSKMPTAQSNWASFPKLKTPSITSK